MQVVYGVHALSLQNNDPQLGWLFTASTIGSLMASITLLGLFGHLFELIVLVVAPNLWVALVVIALWQFNYTLIIVIGITVRQLVTPDELLS